MGSDGEGVRPVFQNHCILIGLRGFYLCPVPGDCHLHLGAALEPVGVELKGTALHRLVVSLCQIGLHLKLFLDGNLIGQGIAIIGLSAALFRVQMDGILSLCQCHGILSVRLIGNLLGTAFVFQCHLKLHVLAGTFCFCLEIQDFLSHCGAFHLDQIALDDNVCHVHIQGVGFLHIEALSILAYIGDFDYYRVFPGVQV